MNRDFEDWLLTSPDPTALHWREAQVLVRKARRLAGTTRSRARQAWHDVGSPGKRVREGAIAQAEATVP